MDIVQVVTEPANIAAFAVAVLSFATILTLAAPAFKRDSLDARLKSVATRREDLRRRSREAIGRPAGIPVSTSTLRRTDEGMYKRVVERLQLRKLLEDPKVVDKLAQAGFRGPKPVTTFYFFRFVTPFVLAIFVGFYLFVVNDFGLPALSRLCFTFMGFAAGFYAPSLYVKNVADKRRGSIMLAFPDALDLLLICVESGMSIEAAILKVSQEIGGSSIELAEELTLLAAELSYLPERRLAYEGLAKRTNHPGIKSVTTAMIQAERYGTPLGSALRIMAKENRDLRMSAAEKKAAALPAKLTVPMILFFLPVLFMCILGPAIIRFMDMSKK